MKKVIRAYSVKNIIAIENKDYLFAYGDAAFDMYEKAPANIHISYPLCNGVIADIKNMQTLVKCFISDLNEGTISRRIIILRFRRM